MPKKQNKIIITCAVTGGIHTPTMSDALPYTPDDTDCSASVPAFRGPVGDDLMMGNAVADIMGDSAGESQTAQSQDQGAFFWPKEIAERQILGDVRSKICFQNAERIFRLA